MEAIAIVGMAGRFPKAANLDEYWRNLCAGVEGITFFSEQELLAAGLPAELVRRPNYVRAKGYLDEAEYFDAAFFGYHPRDAEVIDPQQRLLLESAWSALEDAGYVADPGTGSIGVFVGVSMNTYLVNNLLGNREFLASVGGYQVMISNDKDYAATRISYLLNLRGPALGIQTACSTSLVAVERACQSLASGECEMALAGGASLGFPRRAGYLYQDGMILSPDGHCRVFDADARGTVGGEGVGVVVLKRLREALRDGDHVRAVIRGWATNNDGSEKVGYTAPAVNGQAAVITKAQAMAGVQPRSITYVEAHGTGTELGDPVEIAALTQAFHGATRDCGYCRIGSVKSSIGHLDAAAGVAGLIKATLALQHRCLPPTLHFQRANPHIDWERSPFRVQAVLANWETDQLPRRAGVSSFGIGGTNAHVVLEEAPDSTCDAASRRQQLLVLSAKSDAALDVATANLAEFLRGHPAANLADVAFTLQVGRKAFAYRRALVCESADEALKILEGGDPSRLLSAFERLNDPPLAFLFPGQGAQHVGMGRQIYEEEACFRHHFDACARQLNPLLEVDLREVVYPAAGTSGQSLLDNTALAQPALFAVEYALAKQWEAWGVRPSAMIGHSIGEFVAACLAGVFSIEDALRLVAQRGRLMQSVRQGAMLAVPLSAAEVADLLDDDLSLAACNAPANSVVSGTKEAVSRVETFLQSQGFETHRLHTSHAFHSPMMLPIADRFRECVEQVVRRAPTIPFLSNVTGDWITEAQATDAGYWVDHLLQTVRFSEGMAKLMRKSGQILLEVGPGRALSSIALQIVRQAGQNLLLSSMRHPHDPQPDMDVLLHTLARIWLAGGRIDWRGFHALERRRRIALPTYPFERRRYLVEPPKGSAVVAAVAPRGRSSPADWFYVPGWKQISQTSNRAVEPPFTQREKWLLFADTCGVGDELRQRLTKEGQIVAVVTTGPSFSAGSDNSFTVHPQRFGDYVSLFEELKRRERLPDRIVHLWNVTRDNDRPFDDWQQLGFYSLLYLAQVLGRQPIVSAIHMDVISNGLQEVIGNEPITPARATLRGPLLVIPQEYPHIVLRSIDIEPLSHLASETEWISERLFHELRQEVHHTELALRGRYCWARSHDPLRIEAPRTTPFHLRERGVYWILGGLGQIGLALAHELARVVQARLVLTGRTALPPRQAWEAICDQRDADEPEVRKCRRLLLLESLGAEVLVENADIADLDQLRRVMKKVRSQYGELHGMIHSAGRVDGRIMHYLTPADCEAQFQAKVQGLINLEQLIAGQPLDFCLINSSLSAVVGGMGFCAYAAANAFLDAFAQRMNRRGGVPWFSVNWDGWRFVQPAASQAEGNTLDLLLSEDDGADAFARLCSQDWPDRIVVSTSDLRSRIDQWVSRQSSRVTAEAVEEPKTTVHPRPANLTTQYVAPRTDLERDICDIWQQMLGIEKIGIHDNYIELGGHSLLAGQLISRSREVLKVPLSIRSLFESPNVALFAAHVETQRWAMQSTKPPSALAADDQREEFEL